MDVRFIDTTFRDGSQSLWASGMRTGMIEAVAEAMDRAGFRCHRGARQRHLYQEIRPRSEGRPVGNGADGGQKDAQHGQELHGRRPHSVRSSRRRPRSIVELFYTRLVEIGALNRAQLTCQYVRPDQAHLSLDHPDVQEAGAADRHSPSPIPISPRHTDEYYAQKTRELLPFKPDAIYLKDQGGLLTVDRARTLLPVIVQNAGGVPVELHSHCTTGLAPLVYLEALRLGVRDAAHGRAAAGQRLLAAVGAQRRAAMPG